MKLNVQGALAKMRERRAAEADRAAEQFAALSPPPAPKDPATDRVVIALATFAQGKAAGFGLVIARGDNVAEWANHVCGGDEKEAKQWAVHLAKTITTPIERVPKVYVESGPHFERARELAKMATMFHPVRVK